VSCRNFNILLYPGKDLASCELPYIWSFETDHHQMCFNAVGTWKSCQSIVFSSEVSTLCFSIFKNICNLTV